ncbi:MAG: AMP-binding protein [Huintestinicola sp.]
MKLRETMIQRCRERPDSVIYEDGKGTITRGELLKKASAAAGYFSTLPGGGIMLCGDRSGDMLCAIAGCILAGRTYIPCGSSFPDARLAAISAASGAAAVLSWKDISLPFTAPEAVFGEWEKAPLFTAYEDSGEPMYIIFTSGSTGEPKGVPISEGNVLSFMSFAADKKGLCIKSSDRIIAPSAFSFDLSCADIFPALFMGCSVSAVTAEELSNIETWKRIEKCSRMNCTPSFLRLFLTCSQAENCSIDTVMCCGEALRSRTAAKFFRRFPNARLINAYGPTEACCAVSASVITTDMENVSPLPCGNISSAAVNIHIEDDEIILEGESVFGGYLKGEPLKGAYRTGDKGVIRDGDLYCLSRLDRMIKFKGYRIEAGDIEAAACSCGAENALLEPVYGRDGDVSHLRLTVWGEGISQDSLRADMAALLPDYMLPKAIVISSEQKLNDSYKAIV